MNNFDTWIQKRQNLYIKDTNYLFNAILQLPHDALQHILSFIHIDIYSIEDASSLKHFARLNLQFCHVRIHNTNLAIISELKRYGYLFKSLYAHAATSWSDWGGQLADFPQLECISIVFDINLAITSLDDEIQSWRGMRCLKHVDIDTWASVKSILAFGNGFETLETLKIFSSIHILDVSYMPNLQTLSLQSHNIKELYFGYAPKLTYLNVSGCSALRYMDYTPLPECIINIVDTVLVDSEWRGVIEHESINGVLINT